MPPEMKAPRGRCAAYVLAAGALALMWAQAATGPQPAGAADLLVIPSAPGAAPAAVRPAEMTYTVLLPVVMLDPGRLPVFGVETNRPITGGVSAERLDELGVGWERLGSRRISWRSLQPDEGGAVRWELLTDLEAELRLLRIAEIQPRVVIEDSPRWATITETSCSAVRTDKFDAFAAFVGALVARYSTGEFGVHDWELGNEPDVAPDPGLPLDSVYGCWGDPTDPFYGGGHYGEMLKVVGPAMRAADPSVQIWLGGLLLDRPLTTAGNTGRPELFLQGILEAGAAPWFDVVGYHAYGYYGNVRLDFDNAVEGPWSSWGGRTVGKAQYVQDLLAAYGVSKPVVLNEAALTCETKFGCVPDAAYLDAQADYLVRSFVRGRSAGVAGLVWFTLEAPGWRNASLLDIAGNPRPAFEAYQFLTGQLARRQVPVPVDYGAEIEAYEYPLPPNEAQVLWTRNDLTTTVSIADGRLISAADRFGQPLTAAAIDGGTVVTVTFSPIYLVLKPD